jgi:D-amino-acid dehydrogenase
MRTRQHVVVVGAGIVGAMTAVECLRQGMRVTVIEPGEVGGAQSATFGSGGWINPAGFLPMSVPGLWKKVPGYLADPMGPFTIRWRNFVALVPWLLRFLCAGSSFAKVEESARARYCLSADTVKEHKALAALAGVPELVREEGLLYLYTTDEEYTANAFEWRLRKEVGLPFETLDRRALQLLEPSLGDHYQRGVLVTGGGHLSDPGAYCRALVDYARQHGAELRVESVKDISLTDKQLRGLVTDSGHVSCDKVIICAGIGSKHLAARAGDRIPLESERGYHVEIDEPAVTVRHPAVLSDGKMVVTPTAHGLRVAGQVELASVHASPNWRRARILLDFLPRMLPAMGERSESARVTYWMGHRPSTPDSLPCLGFSSRSRDIIYGFGHGHSGLTMAPASARLLAALARGGPLPIDPQPYSPQRFRGFFARTSNDPFRWPRI